MITHSINENLDLSTNMVLYENRIANAELRMGMSKIADDVKNLLDKFHTFELTNIKNTILQKNTETMLKMILKMDTAQADNKLQDIKLTMLNEDLLSNCINKENSNNETINNKFK